MSSEIVIWNLTEKELKKKQLQWTLVTMAAFVPKEVAIKMNLLLYRILNEQTDM